MNAKTNNFFENSTKLNITTPITTEKQQQQQSNQQQQQQSHFLLALPIQSHNNNTTTPSSSPTNSSSSLTTEKHSINSKIHFPIENSKISSQIPAIGSSTIISPITSTRYHLNRLLGQGSFSKVIQATCNIKPIQQSVALKLVRISCNSTSTNLTNLIYQDHIPTDEIQFTQISTLREIEILKSIKHPSIIKLIETFSISDQELNLEKDVNDTIESIKKNSSLKVIVLEEIKGGELFELVSQSNHFLKPIIICRLMAELSIAVHWLHSHHIIHRDLKLENILLVRKITNEESTVEDMKRNRNVFIKLTDFGLSVKMTTDDKTLGSKTGLLKSRCGSEEYAAPELILGRMYDGRKTDAWALGVIGYSLVMGILPFKLPEPYNFKTEHMQQVEKEETNKLDYQIYLKKRKQGLLKIIKSEFSWNIPQVNSTNTSQFRRDDVTGQIDLVNQLLSRDPTKRPTDLLFGFRDPNWLGQFEWLKNLLLFSSDS